MSELKPCPTPITDAAISECSQEGFEVEICFADFTRTLERELIATQVALKECGETLQSPLQPTCQESYGIQMTDLDYSNLNDKIAIMLLYILTTAMITLGSIVVTLSILDSRSMQPSYRTDAWFMRLAIIPYDFLKSLITKIRNRL